MKTAMVLGRVDGTGNDPSCHWTEVPVSGIYTGNVFIPTERFKEEKPRIVVASSPPVEKDGRWEVECYEITLTMTEVKRLAEALLSQCMEKYLQQILERAFRRQDGCGLILSVFTEDWKGESL